MKSLKIPWLIVGITICTMFQAQAQTRENNVVIINRIYDALENDNVPSLIANWVPDMKWYKSSKSFNKNEKYSFDNEGLNEIYVLFENEWEKIIFKNLNIQQIEENVVLVTGFLTGRKAKETEAVSLEFQHLWWLKDGKVTKFLE